MRLDLRFLCLLSKKCDPPQDFGTLAAYSYFEKGCRKQMCTRQSRKVIWDMINTLFLTTVPVEPTFVAFL